MTTPAAEAPGMAADLFDAIEAGDIEAVQRIVDRDPSQASTRNDAGLSAVLAAAYRHRRDIVHVLLAASPPLDVFDASASGDLERLGELLDADGSLATAY